MDIPKIFEKTLVSLNGKHFYGRDSLNNTLNVFDRSFLYGDSVYEVVRTYGRRPFGLDEHLARLFRSCALMHLKPTWTAQTLKLQVLDAISGYFRFNADPKVDVYVRIVLSRGTGTIMFGEETLFSPSTLAIIVQPLWFDNTSALQKGLHFKIVDRIRNHPEALDPQIKSGNYLNSLLAFLEARPVADDALLLTEHGFVTEGSTFNIFYIKNNIIVTPPTAVGILHGITRAFIFETIQELGLELREVDFKKEKLFRADEVFMSSSTKEILPVTRLSDGVTRAAPIGKGTPGPLTLRLRAALLQKIAKKIQSSSPEKSA